MLSRPQCAYESSGDLVHLRNAGSDSKQVWGLAKVPNKLPGDAAMHTLESKRLDMYDLSLNWY